MAPNYALPEQGRKPYPGCLIQTNLLQSIVLAAFRNPRLVFEISR
jgi:hypothetical protein